ncbi:hypothetical protein VE01_05637 [Pseudogymnoascus verrucosus]|uniref:Uncharacterized protein n=1 Tax=Pseudogymnoascus verrucosus TaxID=342668 RepID=A0A1B8GKT8_9PEZI|nr:uncharacterized protein VE01_05637 [Pseudogymnoascus verrucosus]OBT96453.2 hypothetical protein VE01_05637 [Pseudogymnoascus verrucosus]
MHFLASLVTRTSSTSIVLRSNTNRLLQRVSPLFGVSIRRHHIDCDGGIRFNSDIHRSAARLKNMSRWQDSVTLEVQGPHKEDDDGHKEALLSQLQNARKDIQSLKIDDDTPSDTEWRLISDHFSDVQNLEMEADFNEELNDGPIPTNWPLERLLVSSSCGERFRSPVILEGRVKHLILLLTSGLRFEGPTSNELSSANKEAIERGEAEANYITVREGTPEEHKVEIVSLPSLAFDWLKDKYTNPGRSSDPETPVPELVYMEILEILENDALDTFTRMTLALPYIVGNLKTLNLRSSNGHDFQLTPKEMFHEILPQLTELKTFVFTVGDIFDEADFLPLFYKQFPPTFPRFASAVQSPSPNQSIGTNGSRLSQTRSTSPTSQG